MPDQQTSMSGEGLRRKSPLAGVLTTVFFFSLAGIPPLGGWFAKFVVFRSLLGSANSIGIALGVVGAINAVIALVYYARISKVIWMDEPKSINEEKIFQFENPLKVVGVFTVLITFRFWNLSRDFQLSWRSILDIFWQLRFAETKLFLLFT